MIVTKFILSLEGSKKNFCLSSLQGLDVIYIFCGEDFVNYLYNYKVKPYMCINHKFERILFKPNTKKKSWVLHAWG